MKVEQVISKVKKLLPSLAILPELRKSLKDTEASIHDIVALIEMDPALLSQILRISNSPYYGFSERNTSIDDAIIKIGFHEVYKIVAVLLANSALSVKNKVYDLKADEAWLNSVRCAVAMQHLARLVKADDDLAYTAGLLHGIGRTAISAYFAGSKTNAISFKGANTVSQERKLLGFDHAEVGATLLGQWNFSDEITMPIMYQFSPGDAGEYEKSALLLSLAKQFLPFLDLEPVAVIESAQIDQAVLDELSIYEDDLIDSVADMKDRLNDLSQLTAA